MTKPNLIKDLKSGQEVRLEMIKGADILANAVKETLGPKGRNVVIEQNNGLGYPHITKDGVSVARSIFLKDKYQNLGAQMIKQVAAKSADDAGDGTTTATVLAQAMLHEGIKALASEYNPVFIQRGMNDACKYYTEELKKISKKVTTNDEIKQVGTISANGDTEIGSLIAEGMAKAGEYGVVTVGDSDNNKTYLECVDGLSFDRGFISPYLINNPQTFETVFEDCYLLLVDQKISNFEQELVPILTKANEENKFPLVIIAEDFIGNVIPSVITNVLPNPKERTMGIPLSIVKAPGYGERRLPLLEDIAAVTGGTVISKDKGLQLHDVGTEVFGMVKKIKIGQFETVLIDGQGDKKAIQDRIDTIKQQMEVTISDYDKQTYKERLSKITGGIAVLKVGGATELEIKEKKDRIDDALAATKSATEEGIVTGGGTALYNLGKENSEKENKDSKDASYNIGWRIVTKALSAPIRQILTNAGIENVDEVLTKINKEQGYNAATDEFVDMFEAGIIDPAKVVRCALENAVSVAGLMLTTACGIVGIEEKDSMQTNAC